MTILNYSLNKLVPFLIIMGVSIHTSGWMAVEPWIILLASAYIGHFEFKTGYSVAWCEARGIDPLQFEDE